MERKKEDYIAHCVKKKKHERGKEKKQKTK